MARLNRTAVKACTLLLMLAMLFTTTAFATSSSSIRVSFLVDGQPITGAELSLYQIAVEKNGELEKTPDFQYPVDVEATDGGELSELAYTLYGYIRRDDPAPTQTIRTSNNGQALFTGLPDGLYLVMGEPVTMGNMRYTPNPVLVRFPQAGGATAEINLKHDTETITPNPPDDNTANIKALKVWRGDDGDHPDEVTVQLLRNGKVYDTQVLDEDNNWRFLWTGLPAGSEWVVVEDDVPEGYAVSISKTSITFVVTNEYQDEYGPDDEDGPGPTPPDDGKDPTGPEETPEPTEPVETPEPTDPNDNKDPAPSETPTPTEDEDPGKPTLPQTGQLWWPVLALSILGITLVGAGIIMQIIMQRRKRS